MRTFQFLMSSGKPGWIPESPTPDPSIMGDSSDEEMQEIKTARFAPFKPIEISVSVATEGEMTNEGVRFRPKKVSHGDSAPNSPDKTNEKTLKKDPSTPMLPKMPSSPVGLREIIFDTINSLETEESPYIQLEKIHSYIATHFPDGQTPSVQKLVKKEIKNMIKEEIFTCKSNAVALTEKGRKSKQAQQ